MTDKPFPSILQLQHTSIINQGVTPTTPSQVQSFSKNRALVYCLFSMLDLKKRTVAELHRKGHEDKLSLGTTHEPGLRRATLDQIQSISQLSNVILKQFEPFICIFQYYEGELHSEFCKKKKKSLFFAFLLL